MRKDVQMDEELVMEEETVMLEQIERLAKANRTWEILDLLKSCSSFKEANEKVKALLQK